MQVKNKRVNEQLLNEHEKGLKLQDVNKKLVQTIEELKKRVQQLMGEIGGWQRKQKILLQSLKTKGNDAYESQKKISQLQQQMFMLQQKIQSQTKQMSARQHTYQKITQQKDKQITEYQNQIAELRLDLGNIDDELQKVLNELALRKKELIVAGDSIKEYVESGEKKDKRIEELYVEVEAGNNRVNGLQEELGKSKRLG